MAKRAQVRLGVLGATTGDRLVPPGPNVTARAMFLRAVERTVPAAFRALVAIATAPDEPGATRASSAVNARLAQLRAWGDQFGFTAPWLRRVAGHTYHLLAAADPGQRPSGFVLIETGIEDIGACFPNPPRWDPIVQSRGEYHAAIDAYLDACTALAMARGWTAAPVKRTADHFEWLARYQCGGWTQEHIADRYKEKSDAAVSLALDDVAALVGITRRPPAATRGRRKSETARLT